MQEALQKEVGMLTSLNHPNLVRFCGVCLDPPLLVMEYYRHGSVFGMLDRARRQLAKCRAPGGEHAAAGANQKVRV
jgi:serine/threonine protein kinase